MSEANVRSDHIATLRRLAAASGEAAARRRRYQALASAAISSVQTALRGYWTARIEATVTGVEESKTKMLSARAPGAAAYLLRSGSTEFCAVLSDRLVSAIVAWEFAGAFQDGNEISPCAAIDRLIAQGVARIIAGASACAFLGVKGRDAIIAAAAPDIEALDIEDSDEVWIIVTASLRAADGADLGEVRLAVAASRVSAPADCEPEENRMTEEWTSALASFALSAPVRVEAIIARRVIDIRNLASWEPGALIALDAEKAGPAEMCAKGIGKQVTLCMGGMSETNTRRIFRVAGDV